MDQLKIEIKLRNYAIKVLIRHKTSILILIKRSRKAKVQEDLIFKSLNGIKGLNLSVEEAHKMIFEGRTEKVLII
jgi:hypothetical protein